MKNRLKEALIYYKENTKYYSNINVDDITKNKIITKKIYKENSYPKSDNMSVRKNTSKYVFSTSGTTNNPQYVIRNIEDINYQVNDYIGLNINEDDVILNLFWGGIWGVYTTNNLVLSKTKATIIPYGGNNMKDLSQIDKVIKDLNVNVLLGVPSTIVHIAKYYENKKNIPNITKVFCLGEKMDSITYNYIKYVFPDCNIKTKYGCMESAGIGYQCSNLNCNKYHIYENRYVEIIDRKTNNLCNYNEVGKIIVTTLDERLVPLVRYDTGDIGYIKKINCECGIKEVLTIISKEDDEFIVASVHLSKTGIKRIIVDNTSGYISHQIVVDKYNNMDRITIYVDCTKLDIDDIIKEIYIENPDLYDIVSEHKINDIIIESINDNNYNKMNGKFNEFIDRR